MTVPLHSSQRHFRRSDALWRGFVGGRGAGKSYVGAFDLLMRTRPGRLYLAAAPTYDMLRDASLRTFLGLAEKLKLYRDYRDMNRSMLIVRLVNGAEVLFRSAGEPERLRGPNLSGVWLDEASLMERAALEVCIACLREGGEQGWLSATFTPKGRQHWTYDVFGHARPNTALFHARTADNPFLPAGFDDAVRALYPASLAAQELEGQFVEGGGSIFPRDGLRVVEAGPAKAARVRYWDKAGTEGGGAYTAGVLFGRTEDGLYFVENVVRGQWGSHARNQVMLETAKADRQRCGSVQVVVEQEPGSGGKESAEYTLKLLAGFPVFAERVTGDKLTRAQPLAAQVQAGNVRLVRGSWNTAYIDELSTFPAGPYKDQVDASAGAFNRLAGVPGRIEVGLPGERRHNVAASAPAGVFGDQPAGGW